MKLKKFEVVLVVLLVLIVGTCMLLETQAAELSGSLIRLRVVANSDSEADQTLKIQVRDAVLELSEALIAEAGGRDEAEALLRASLPDIQTAAEEVVAGRYEVRVFLENEVYGTRDYEGFSLPAGTYRSLRIELGQAEGQNWWCCVFPPLCTAASMGSLEEVAETAGFSKAEVTLITEQDGYTLKFKALEFWQWFKSVF